MKKILKIISVLLIQAILMFNTAAVNAQGSAYSQMQFEQSTLAPEVTLSIKAFQYAYDKFLNDEPANADLLPFEKTISAVDAENNGTLISAKTTNFKIGTHNFRVPPYLAGRVARVHVTTIDSNGFKFQKMGIGVGRRKKTIAVILVDVFNLNNQLLIYEEDGRIKLKHLGISDAAEILLMGKDAKFGAMHRQDSFLERSNHGITFLNRCIGISKPKEGRPQETVIALKSLSRDNPKLMKDLAVNLAFFSQDYMLVFSENLKNNSHVEVLRDREQRGRFIAIVDKLNPDNRVVFERRGEKIYVLGDKERVIISKLTKHKKMQTIYFTDIEEGARFCRNVTRNLINLDFAHRSNSISIRKGVQLNVGAFNSDTSLLKVNQVTQSTLTGYQVKKRIPELMDKTLATYPLYIMRDDFKHNLTVKESEVDYESADFAFFGADDTKNWPAYLSYGNAQNAVYYQRLIGKYDYEGEDLVVYRAISKEDILTALAFSNDGSFTIAGINWIDGRPVVFRNVKNIALSNIVSQLNSSKFIDIDPVLVEYFDVTNFELGLNNVRTTYRFKDNTFEQAGNVTMIDVIDFSEFQEKEDKKIKKAKNFKLNIPKAMLIMSFLFLSIPQVLFAGNLGSIINTASSDLLSGFGFVESFVVGVGLLGGMVLIRVVKHFKQMIKPANEIYFSRSRRTFLHDASIKGLMGFLVLQTGIMAFVEIYNMLKNVRYEAELGPRVSDNLRQLALIYEGMPHNVYALNKRLLLPRNYQYWQMFLGLKSKGEALKAAQIYKENADAILKFYSSPMLNGSSMSASELLRLIANRIDGKNTNIKQKKRNPRKIPEPKDVLVQNPGTLASIILPGALSKPLISKIDPLDKSRIIKREDKKQLIFKKSKKTEGQDDSVFMDKLELSSEGKRLSREMISMGKVEQAI